jgi:hypothetical protein
MADVPPWVCVTEPAAPAPVTPEMATVSVARDVPMAQAPALPEIGIDRGTATDPTAPGAPGGPVMATMPKWASVTLPTAVAALLPVMATVEV